MSAHRVKAWLRACLNSERVIFLEVEVDELLKACSRDKGS